MIASDYAANLAAKMKHPGFLSDTQPLLRPGIGERKVLRRPYRHLVRLPVTGVLFDPHLLLIPPFGQHIRPVAHPMLRPRPAGAAFGHRTRRPHRVLR